MTKRKTVLGLLIIAMVFVMAFFITACDDPTAGLGGSSGSGQSGSGSGSSGSTDDGTGDSSGSTHEHIYTSWKVDVEATCDEAGSESRSCAVCKEVETREIAALGHSFSESWQNDGSKHWHICTRCTSVKTEDSNHLFDQNECTVCSFNKYTSVTNLTFSPIMLVDDIVGYSVTGASFPASETVVSIPPTNSLGNNLPVLEIGREAFKDNTKITKVIIPEGVTKIHASAFSGCTALTSVVIPSTVATISTDAFKDCYKLVEIYNCSTKLSDKMTVGATTNGGIARYAKNIYTPSAGASKLTKTDDGYIFYSENAASHYLLGYVGAQSSLNLPQSFNGGGYSIYDYAFAYNNLLTGVTIPSTVTAIGTYAFAGCSGISGKLTIPSGITLIDNYSFMGCLGLNDLELPTSLTAIGDLAFAGCSGFQSITLPDSISVLGDGAFLGCTGLKNLNLSTTLMTIGDMAFSNCSGLGSITIPDSVTSIGSQAFSLCSGLTSITLSTNSPKLATIGQAAFLGCEGLSSVVIPSSVTTIGESAFADCTGLSYAEIYGNEAQIWDSAFSGCTGLSTLNIRSGIASIGNRTFENCSSLTSVTIPDSVTTLGNYVFSGCTDMISVTIGNGVTAIFTNTFSGCGSISSLKIGNGVSIIQDYAFAGFDNLISLTLGDGLTTIYAGAFSDCDALTSLTIPQSVTTIMDGAFKGCSNITKIKFAARAGVYESGLTTIGANAFEGLSKLEEIELPDSLTTIGIQAFKGCSSLSEISYRYVNERSLTTIGSRAFENCTSLSGFDIPSNVTTIGDYAFTGCTSLIYISSGSGITTITSRMFSGCTALKEITLYSGLTTIGKSAFENFTNLETVTMNSSTTLTTIGNSAFAGCTALKSIDLPKSVEMIGASAFKNCSALEHISFGASLNFIGSEAFEGCTSLADVSYDSYINDNSNGVWGEIAGIDDASLGNSVIFLISHSTLVGIIDKVGKEEIVIPERSGIYKIGEKAFDNNKKLKSIYIPASVDEIEPNAFAECINLQRVHYEGTRSDWDKMTIRQTGNQEFLNAKRGYANYFTYEAINDNTAYVVSGLISTNRASAVTYEIPDTFFDLPVIAIKDRAFENCSLSKVITIGNNIKTIGANAFANADLTYSGEYEMIIPDNVTSMGDGVFANFRELSGVTIGAGLEAIPSNAFANTGITGVTIPDTVKSIGEAAFMGCAGLRRVNLGAKVESIGARAFKGTNNSRFSSITIPDSVTTIGEEAFADCTHLSSIELGAGLTALADRVFSNCSLVNVVLPYELKEIGEGVFQDCSYLESVRIPAYITRIAASAFKSCNRLKTVYFDGMQEDWKKINISADNSLLLNATIGIANYLEYELVEGASQSTYTVIGEIAKYDEAVIVVPDTYFGVVVDSIATNTESMWTASLKEITIGHYITSIGDNSFGACPALDTIRYAGNKQAWAELPKGETGNDCLSNEGILMGYANYLAYTKLDDNNYRVDGIISGTAEIDIVIPNTYLGVAVTQIKADAFKNNLMYSVTIPENVVVIDKGAFTGCSALARIYYDATEKQWLEAEKNLEDNTPLQTAHIGYANFLTYEQEQATYIVTGEIEGYNKEHIDIPETYFGLNVWNIAVTDENMWSNLKEIHFGEYIRSIAQNSFVNASNIETVYFDGTEEEWEQGFYGGEGNSYLVNAQIGFANYLTYEKDNDEYIVTGIIEGSAETDVIIPDTYLALPVTVIKAGAFTNNENMRSVSIPANVTKIEHSAFSGCSSIETVYYEGKEAMWKDIEIAADGLGNTALTSANIGYKNFLEYELVTDGTTGEESYKVVGVTKRSAQTLIDIPNTYFDKPVTEIEYLSFSDNKVMTAIRIPLSIEENNESYSTCENLKNVIYEGTAAEYDAVRCNGLNGLSYSYLNHLAYSAYGQDENEGIPTHLNVSGINKYSSVREFVVPQKIYGISVLGVDAEAFNLNTQIDRIDLGYITSVSDLAFSGSSLVHVELPATVGTLSYTSFQDCANLELVNYHGTRTEFATIDKSGVNNNSWIGKLVCANYLTYTLHEATNPEDSTYSVSGVIERYGRTDIEIPSMYAGKSVTAIEAGAFAASQALNSVVVPTSIVEIGGDVFNADNVYYEGFASAWANVTKSDELAEALAQKITFGNDLIYSLNNDTYMVTGLADRTLTDVVIPYTYHGIAVTGIVDTFFDNYNFTSIEIPTSVVTLSVSTSFNRDLTVIYHGTEADWEKIDMTGSFKENVTIGYSCYLTYEKVAENYAVTGVIAEAKSALNDQSNSFVVPSEYFGGSVTSIAAGAFNGATKLDFVEIPTSVLTVAADAINATAIYYAGNSTQWASVIGDVDLGETSVSFGNNLAYAVDEETHYYTVIGMAEGATINEIVIPREYHGFYVEAIAAGAFGGDEITSVVITTVVKIIGAGAFDAATPIYFEGSQSEWEKIIKTGNEFTNVGIANYLEYSLNADGNGYTVTGQPANRKVSVVIPSTYFGKPVTAIAANAFGSITSSTSIVIPTSVTTIGDNAFGEDVTAIYYAGDSTAWAEQVDESKLYFYSETAPTTAGNFWHYVEGVPTVYPAYVGSEEPTE